MGTHVSISLFIQYLARKCERCFVVSHAAISALMEAKKRPVSERRFHTAIAFLLDSHGHAVGRR